MISMSVFSIIQCPNQLSKVKAQIHKSNAGGIFSVGLIG